MQPFKTSQGAWLRCQTDFSGHAVLNIDFVDDSCGDIPFHLSLRHSEGVAVVNRQLGGQWRREVTCPLDLAIDTPNAVDIAFAPGRVRVAVNGTLLGRFDAFPRPSRGGRYLLRRGFPGLDRISAVRTQGALATGSLRMFCPALPVLTSGLSLTDSLELVAPGGLLSPDDTGRITGTGLNDPPALLPLPLPYTDSDARPLVSLTAVLPGRVWRGGVPQLELRLETGRGMVVGAVTLSRNDLLDRIQCAAQAGLWATNPLAALQAIEHVRYANLLSELAPATQHSLFRAAEGLGLGTWLGAASAPEALPSPITRPAASAPDAIQTLISSILLCVRNENADPVALAHPTLTDATLDRAQRAQLLRAMVEPCCLSGRMPALADLAARTGLLPLPDAPAIWDQTTAMAFDPVQGWFGAVAGRLHHLDPAHEGWAVTPAIGWAVEQVVSFAPAQDGRVPSLTQHRDVIEAFLHYLNRLAPDYWSRSPCTALMSALIAVLARPERVPADLAEKCRNVALRLWGLSPVFWARLGACSDLQDDPLLSHGRDLYARLESEVLRPDPDHLLLDTLLSGAQALGMADTTRWRREVLGPSGLPSGQPDPGAAQLRGMDGNETCLRALLHPDRSVPPDPVTEIVVQDAAGRGLRTAYLQVQSAPLAALEVRMMGRARALMKSPDPDSLAEWGRDLTPLCSPDQGSAGITLALGLAAGLARSGQTTAATLLLQEGVLESSLAQVIRGDGGGAVRQALAVLARHAPELARQFAKGTDLPLPAPTIDLLSAAANPLHDTLVAVYSCRPYLETRVAALRRSWLADLDKLGVPYLVFTGDGAGGPVPPPGNVVHLDAPDNYEGLPDKSLALFRWVLTQTGFSRVVKVDDDCLMAPEIWFGDLTHLRHDYLGRPLNRAPGQTDRLWHMEKSHSDRGRLELDKSPEPSRHADGSTGYMLSRHAMTKLMEAADSPQGQRLQQLSFMEDKLVGDLLALRGIFVSGEEYCTSVWRRNGTLGRVIPAWENGVLPFAGGPVKLAHLDDATLVEQVHPRTATPWPQSHPAGGKIWPSYQSARAGSRSNTLDLLSPPDRLTRARNAPVAVIACLRNEALILPSFLTHYRKLGVEAFLIADNGSDDGTLDLLADAPDVALFSVDTEYSQSQYGVAWQQALLSNFRVGAWSLVADADEFLVWSDDPAACLPDLLDQPVFQTADAARVLMLDMYPQGPLSGVTLTSGDLFGETGMVDRQPFLRHSTGRGPFTDSEVLTSALRHRLIPGSRPELFVAQKYALLRYRPWMRLSAGLHFVAGVRPAPQDLLFAHFKYTAAFRNKAMAEVQRRQHFNNAEEYQKYLALLSEGREVIHDPAVSVEWRECKAVQQVMAAWSHNLR